MKETFFRLPKPRRKKGLHYYRAVTKIFLEPPKLRKRSSPPPPPPIPPPPPPPPPPPTTKSAVRDSIFPTCSPPLPPPPHTHQICHPRFYILSTLEHVPLSFLTAVSQVSLSKASTLLKRQEREPSAKPSPSTHPRPATLRGAALRNSFHPHS